MVAIETKRAWVVVVLFTTACATEGHLSNNVVFCCGAPGPAISTYSLTFTSMPTFLTPTMRDALVAALSAKGLRQVDENPDALITLHFEAVYSDSNGTLAHDGFADPLAVGGLRNFDARLTLDIRRAANGAQVMRGVLSREHRESVGDYGHERGRADIQAGFVRLLRRLPAVPHTS